MSVRIRVWDLPVRLFHWSLVAVVATSLATGWAGGRWMTWHLRSGYALVALLVFRWAWGLVGSHHARWAHFLAGPRRVVAYLRGEAPQHWLGHNPAGGWSVLAMLVALSLQVGSGLFANDQVFTEGPLASWVPDRVSEALTRYHVDIGLPLLYGLLALHLAALGYHLLIRREDLLRPMLHGDKHLPDDGAAARPPASRDDWRLRLLAALLLGCGAALALWLRWLGRA